MIMENITKKVTYGYCIYYKCASIGSRVVTFESNGFSLRKFRDASCNLSLQTLRDVKSVIVKVVRTEDILYVSVDED